MAVLSREAVRKRVPHGDALIAVISFSCAKKVYWADLFGLADEESDHFFTVLSALPDSNQFPLIPKAMLVIGDVCPVN